MGELSVGLREPAAGARRQTFVYRVLGNKVCPQAFSEIHSLGHYSLRSLQEFFAAGRIAPLPRKLSGHPASHAISADLKADIITFILNYGASFGMPQPAAPRVARNTPSTYLPKSSTILQFFKLSRRPNPMPRLAILPSERFSWSLPLMSKLWKGEVMFVTNVINSMTECALLKQRSSLHLSLRSWRVTCRWPGKNASFTLTSSMLQKIAWRILPVKSPLHHPLPT